MKKNLLAVSVAAALGLGAGVASAAPVIEADGIGHTNIIPYFSVQGGNMTLLSITNTDLVNGKAVKVRFRGAEWSDDIFDFQVFLSPGDVFTGAVTQNGSVANFTTSDGTCTLPETVNQNFVPIRLQNQVTGTLEGYIEIITMADIVNTNPATGYDVYKATKHVNGVAPCKSVPDASAVLTGLKEENLWQITVTPVAQVPWMVAPTGSLTSYATIINVNNSKAFANVATAVNYTAPVEAYFEQANVALIPTADLTADRIFFPQAGVNTGADVPMYQFDMPDLSTNIEGLADAVAQRDALSMVLQKAGVVAEYSTLDSLQAASDIVISQPTRRYFYNYTLDALTPELTIEGVGYDIDGDLLTPYATLVGATNRVPLAGGAKFFDREERAAGSNIVISPTPPGGTLSLKGEVSVIGINNGAGATGALGALLTINDITAVGQGGATYEEGWAMISTNTGATFGAPYLSANLPVIGFSAQNAFNANAGSAGTNYGTTLPLRYY